MLWDLYTNEIIGWDFSIQMTTELVLNTLAKANINRSSIIHTDRGSQYTSNIYSETVISLGAKLSYSRKGNPYDNACKESLFKYIEDWYNSRRIQKKLGYLSPLEFSKKLA